jgi:hypothetical protein
MTNQEQSEAVAYALRCDPTIAKIVLDTGLSVGARQMKKVIMEIISAESEKCSPETNHGKAQRYFAKILVEKIRAIAL